MKNPNTIELVAINSVHLTPRTTAQICKGHYPNLNRIDWYIEQRAFIITIEEASELYPEYPYDLYNLLDWAVRNNHTYLCLAPDHPTRNYLTNYSKYWEEE